MILLMESAIGSFFNRPDLVVSSIFLMTSSGPPETVMLFVIGLVVIVEALLVLDIVSVELILLVFSIMLVSFLGVLVGW